VWNSCRTVPLWVCLAILTTGPRASAQQTTAQEPYRPTVGQQGKDVVWVPTTEAMVAKMLDHAKVTERDFVMDLGSGDGRMIIAAAKRGARGLGVEFNADMVELAKREAAAAAVADKAMFVQGDMYEADISKATLLALFLLPHNLEKLVPKFLELPAGTRIVVNTYWVTDWTPDDTQTLEEGCESWCTSHLMIVPAKVQGTWRAAEGVFSLTQRFQMVEGTYTPSSGTAQPVKGRLHGAAFTLKIGETDYEGTATGNTIEVAAKGTTGSKIVATRSN
jgi:precorrin-6B methylase 2